jgi:hypothetical protein
MTAANIAALGQIQDSPGTHDSSSYRSQTNDTWVVSYYSPDGIAIVCGTICQAAAERLSTIRFPLQETAFAGYGEVIWSDPPEGHIPP